MNPQQITAVAAPVSMSPYRCVIAPNKMDAKRCISYLTIAARSIPVEFVRSGNRVFGCDDCQLVCPEQIHCISEETDYRLDTRLTAPHCWIVRGASRVPSMKRSPIRRIGYERVANWR